MSWKELSPGEARWGAITAESDLIIDEYAAAVKRTEITRFLDVCQHEGLKVEHDSIGEWFVSRPNWSAVGIGRTLSAAYVAFHEGEDAEETCPTDQRDAPEMARQRSSIYRFLDFCEREKEREAIRG